MGKQKVYARHMIGRSMIEMLGVLAIIAVISIGSYSLYRRAVDTHKANSIFDDVNRFEFVISERIDRAPEGEVNAGDFSPTSGFEMIAVNELAEQRHFIAVSDVPKSVCHIILEKGGDKYVIFAENRLYEGDTKICQDENMMSFYFGETAGLCSVGETEDSPDVCSDKCLCLAEEGKSCKEDLHPDFNDTKCCPNDQVNCFKTCRPACPAGMEYNDRCQCECSDRMKTYDAQLDKCVCKAIDGTVPLVEDENGNCGCEDNTYIWIPSMNKCSKLSCPNGDGGNCTLDDKLCGSECTNTSDASAVTCSAGYCRPDLCTNEKRPFKKMPKYSNGGYWWGCEITDKESPDPNTKCYSRESSNFCFNDFNALKEQCCVANADLQCITGICNQSYCQERFGSGVSYGLAYYVGGCLFEDGTIQCYPTNLAKSKWKCYRSNAGRIACATDCTTPPNCGTCMDACSGEGSPDDDGYCCVTLGTKTVCKENRYYYFKSGDSYDRCGSDCTYDGLTEQEDGTYTATSISCKTGHCQAPICTDTTWSYGKITGDSVWGCVKNGLSCHANKNGGPYACTSCGSQCSTIDNTSCLSWSQKQCAPSVTKNGVTKPACIYGRIQGTTDVDDYDYDCWCQSGNVDEATNICCPSGQVVRGGACVVNQ